MKKPKSYWIKERINPQLGTYYIAMGQISKTEARRNQAALYGRNHIHQFPTEEAYQAELKRLQANGERVQGA
jgi:hypothetical protein